MDEVTYYYEKQVPVAFDTVKKEDVMGWMKVRGSDSVIELEKPSHDKWRIIKETITREVIE